MGRRYAEMAAAPTADPALDRPAVILEAACRVIVREGAHGLRMARVAEEAGVSKALVHYYFSTRQELLRNAFAFSEERWIAAVNTDLADAATGATKVERVLLVSVETKPPFSEQRALWNEVWSSLRADDELRPVVERSYRAWLDRVVSLIEQGQGDGSIPVDGRSEYRGLASRRRRRRSRLTALPRADRPAAGTRPHPELDRPRARRVTDVLVLGAGLAGLAAARDLANQRCGCHSARGPRARRRTRRAGPHR